MNGELLEFHRPGNRKQILGIVIACGMGCYDGYDDGIPMQVRLVLTSKEPRLATVTDSRGFSAGGWVEILDPARLWWEA